jgi:hypothetical protein
MHLHRLQHLPSSSFNLLQLRALPDSFCEEHQATAGDQTAGGDQTTAADHTVSKDPITARRSMHQDLHVSRLVDYLRQGLS